MQKIRVRWLNELGSEIACVDCVDGRDAINQLIILLRGNDVADFRGGDIITIEDID